MSINLIEGIHQWQNNFIKIQRYAYNDSSNLTEKLIVQEVEANKTSLSEKEASLLKQEADYIKFQISQLRKDGVRVVLFDIPVEQRVQSTVRKQQVRALMRKLFPIKQFEWLPEPPSRHWKTSDGIHLVSSDAKDYAAFLRNQLLP